MVVEVAMREVAVMRAVAVLVVESVDLVIVLGLGPGPGLGPALDRVQEEKEEEGVTVEVEVEMGQGQIKGDVLVAGPDNPSVGCRSNKSTERWAKREMEGNKTTRNQKRSTCHRPAGPRRQPPISVSSHRQPPCRFTS